MTFKRSDEYLSLSTASWAMNVEGETIIMNSMPLFQRISIAKRSDDDLENIFYEFFSYPFSLF